MKRLWIILMVLLVASCANYNYSGWQDNGKTISASRNITGDNLTLSGAIKAASFVGDGSQLTGVIANSSNDNETSSLWNKTGNNIYQRELTGNVGIGTNNPTSKLHTIGNANITGNFSAQALSISNSTNNGADFCQLSSGTCTINNNRITADTIILCTAQNGGVNLGALSISARTPGTSYAVTSSSALEADKVGCILFEPKP